MESKYDKKLRMKSNRKIKKMDNNQKKLSHLEILYFFQNIS